MRRIKNFGLTLPGEYTLLSRVRLVEAVNYTTRDRLYHEVNPREVWAFRSHIILDLRDLHEYETTF
jgi:hypothetical protein